MEIPSFGRMLFRSLFPVIYWNSEIVSFNYFTNNSNTKGPDVYFKYAKDRFIHKINNFGRCWWDMLKGQWFTWEPISANVLNSFRDGRVEGNQENCLHEGYILRRTPDGGIHHYLTLNKVIKWGWSLFIFHLAPKLK